MSEQHSTTTEGDSVDKIPVTLGELTTALEKSWLRSTSADMQGWTPDNISWRQCAVSALIVQDHLGGNLLRGEVNGASHYFNRLPDGEIVDLTRQQFPARSVVDNVFVRDRQYVVSFVPTVLRYETLKKRVDHHLYHGDTDCCLFDQRIASSLTRNERTGRYYTDQGVYVPATFSSGVKHSCGHESKHSFNTSLVSAKADKGITLSEQATILFEDQTATEQKHAISTHVDMLHEHPSKVALQDTMCPECAAINTLTEVTQSIEEIIGQLPTSWTPVVLADIDGTTAQKLAARRSQLSIIEETSLEWKSLFLAEIDPFSRSLIISSLFANTEVHVADFDASKPWGQVFMDIMKWELCRKVLSITSFNKVFMLGRGSHQDDSANVLHSKLGLGAVATRATLAIAYSLSSTSVKSVYDDLSKIALTTNTSVDLSVVMHSAEELRDQLTQGISFSEAVSSYVYDEPFEQAPLEVVEEYSHH